MTLAIVIAIVVVVLLVALAVWLAKRARRRAALRSTYGPEYDRVVDDSGRRRAERELAERQQRRESLDIRPLDPAAAARYRDQWRLLQEQFVDSPADAVAQAHTLLTTAMGERGYPTDDRDERMAMLSVDHADVMDEYRSGVTTEQRWRSSGTASTEELRQAMQHYRSVFSRVVGETETETQQPRTQTQRVVN